MRWSGRRAPTSLRTCGSIPGGGALVVAKILDWYAADFGGRRGVLEFVLARMPDEDIAAAAQRHGFGLRLRFEEFDWALNAA